VVKALSGIGDCQRAGVAVRCLGSLLTVTRVKD
jgi:hypothetical protein